MTLAALKRFSLCLMAVTMASMGCEESQSRCTDGVDDYCNQNWLFQCKGGSFTSQRCANDRLCSVEGGISQCAKISCGNIDNVGICDGNTAKRCINDSLSITACTSGQECSMDSGYAQCVGVAGSGCDGVSNEGVCVGNTVKRCENDSIITEDCASEPYDDFYCSIERGQAECLPNYECGSITNAGRCSVNTVERCVGGRVESTNCTNGCIVIGGRADCIRSVRCDEIQTGSICEDGVVKLCDESGSLIIERCASDEECREDNGKAQCFRVSSCGSVNSAGICLENNTAFQRCEENVLVTVRCASDEKCSMENEIVECIKKEDCGSITNAGICNGDTIRRCDSGVLLEDPCPGGQTCSTELGTAMCYDRCSAEDPQGYCDGNIVTRCVSGAFLRDDCSLNTTQNTICVTNNASGVTSNAHCFPRFSTTCESFFGSTETGAVCRGKIAVNCISSSSTPQFVDCSGSCQVSSDSGAASCI